MNLSVIRIRLFNADLLVDQFVRFCDCNESIALQAKLVTHLLQHALKKRKRALKVSHSTSFGATIKINDDRDDSGNDNYESMNYDDADRSMDRSDGTDDEKPLKLLINERTIPDLVITDAALFQCDHCPKSFKSRKCLLNHLIRHKKVEHICDFLDCKKIFNTKHKLTQHKCHVHAPKKMCDKCSMMITSHRMKEHIKAVHTESDPCFKPIKCKEEACGRTFRSYHALKYHKITAHNGERPFMCEFCSKSFPTKAIWKEHCLHHTNPER